MTEIGTVVAGKYEILKEVGHGGMSVVYLAMDTHLNRNWAVKEIRKTGRSKNDEIIQNSILVEANLIKRLDHPALPRIVDIIDNGETIYIVMDFIEGESLDKVLAEYGPQPEEKVIEWAMQVCDVLSYLHSQKPPIIYRDMKPANLMLKPNGNICIIDFGIAREYKEESLTDTRVLGTKGYAPPEQYNGQTDARSDIYALGMTMHHLLTGIDPTSGEQYAPVRYWNPSLSEGIEAIINKCVEPAAEFRYQNCQDLMLDLQDPAKVTRGWKRMLKRRMFTFIGVGAFSVLALLAGVILKTSAKTAQAKDRSSRLNNAGTDLDKIIDVIDMDASQHDAYEKSLEILKSGSEEEGSIKKDDIDKLGNRIQNAVSDKKLIVDQEVADWCYHISMLYLSNSGIKSTKEKLRDARPYFKIVMDAENVDTSIKGLAESYWQLYEVCYKNSTGYSEFTSEDTSKIVECINTGLNKLNSLTGAEANYNRVTYCWCVLGIIDDRWDIIAKSGVEKGQLISIIDSVETKTNLIQDSTNEYINQKKTSILDRCQTLKDTINRNYDNVSKRGGN